MNYIFINKRIRLTPNIAVTHAYTHELHAIWSNRNIYEKLQNNFLNKTNTVPVSEMEKCARVRLKEERWETRVRRVREGERERKTAHKSTNSQLFERRMKKNRKESKCARQTTKQNMWKKPVRIHWNSLRFPIHFSFVLRTAIAYSLA